MQLLQYHSHVLALEGGGGGWRKYTSQEYAAWLQSRGGPRTPFA